MALVQPWEQVPSLFPAIKINYLLVGVTNTTKEPENEPILPDGD
jgi:hypothetical protein